MTSDAQRQAAARWRAANKDKIAAYRRQRKHDYPEERKAERTRWKRTLITKRMTKHTFVGIDGEGWTDDQGEHHCTMICTSTDANLYTGKPLSTLECLEFLSALPVKAGQYYVSFFFDYDVTMILRTMARQDPALAATLFTNGLREWTWYQGYGIKYRPHKNLTVKKRGQKAVEIHDGQGFFQSSFVSALTKFQVGTDQERADILAMKSQRSTFTQQDATDVMAYSQHECRLLAELLGRVRDLSHAAGINAEPYEGPGTVAGRALTRWYGKDKHQAAMDAIPPVLAECLPFAMYGGRFEILAVGNVYRTVDEFDVHSAYPDEMSRLPCLIHGRWSRTRKVRPGSLTLSHISFVDSRPPAPGLAYPLPVRAQGGALHYPQSGSGWYWQHEYDRDTLTVAIHTSWTWLPQSCDCQPFAWVRDLYRQREEMERNAKGSGIVLKLVLNTLYGKCAQLKPVPGVWLNYVYASLITSRLRTRIYDLYLSLPERSVVMFATDALFTVNPGLVDTSDIGLGGLEHAGEYKDMTIIQPGLYFDGSQSHFKTRGIGKSYVIAHGEELRAAAAEGKEVTMAVTQFKGLRLSLSTGNLKDMGNWVETTRTIATRTYTKREGEKLMNGVIWTSPAGPTGESVPRDHGSMSDYEAYLKDLESDDESQTYYGDLD